MKFRCDIFVIMTYQRIFIIFFAIFFIVTKVFTNGSISIPTKFIGLKGDNNMGHSGYIYIASDSPTPEFELVGCKNLDVNETMCRFNATNLKEEGARDLLYAWTAVTLRENILSILGYLMHQSKMTFSDSIEASLKILYEQVRKNNIRILDFLPQFKTLLKFPNDRRSFGLFRALQKSMPIFCRGALENLVRQFYVMRKKILYNSAPINSSIDVGMYLLSNIDLNIIQYIRPTIRRRPYDRTLAMTFGKEYAIFFSNIQNHKLKLTQPILALLILLTRFKELKPYENEDLKLLTDVLLFKKISNWNPSDYMDAENTIDPYILIKSMLKTLSLHNTTDIDLKVIAAHLQNQLTSGFVVDPNKPMLPYFGSSQLNVTLLLDLLEELAPIQESKILSDMIYNGSIDLRYALKGFNRYYYDTPETLLIAFMRRIQNRVPMERELRDSILTIVFYLLGLGTKDEEQNSEETDGRNKRDIGIINVNESYSSDNDDDDSDYVQTSISQSVSQSCHNVNGCSTTYLKIVTNSNVTNPSRKSATDCPVEIPAPSLSQWLKSLEDPATAERPISLVVNVSTVLATLLSESSTVEFLNYIIGTQGGEKNSLINGMSYTILPQYISNISKNSSTILNGKGTKNSEHSARKLNSIKTKKDKLKQILKAILSTPKFHGRSVVFYEAIRVYYILIGGLDVVELRTLNTILQLDGFQSNDIIEKLSQIISKSFKKVIDDMNSKENSSLTELKKSITNRAFLMNLCKKLLTFTSVLSDEILFNEVISLLHSIHDLPMKFTQLMEDVMPETTKDLAQFRIIYDYLANPELLRALGDDFNIGSYTTKGSLFKAIMKKISTYSTVKENTQLLKSINLLIPKIVCTGQGTDISIDSLMGNEPKQRSAEEIIESAVANTKINSDFEQTVSNMWNWYVNNPDLMESSAGSNVSFFESRAPFVQKLLNAVEVNVERDYVGIKNDIQLLRSAILRTSNESALVDHN